jgi:hypothetical protein
MSEPIALRYDFDGHGYLYMDAGSGSDWASRIKDCEFLYNHPQKKLTDEEIAEIAIKVLGTWNSMDDMIDYAKEIIKAMKGEK